MKRVRCPKCGNYIVFDETRYQPGRQLVFVCPDCNKQFGIRMGTSQVKTTRKDSESQIDEPKGELGSIIVVENVFHYRQVIPLEMGDNVFGRYVRGTNINKPIETVDPSVDTKHCIIRVQRNKRGELQYILRDAPSNTGTFYMNGILRDQDRIRLSDSDIITIGATTLILRITAVEGE
ncbi:MAG: FHA domain-containing protein [Bacteroidaceae bacterium]